MREANPSASVGAAGAALLEAEAENTRFPALRKPLVCAQKQEGERGRGIDGAGGHAQHYNYAFGASAVLPETWRESHAFCSELIARVFEEMGFFGGAAYGHPAGLFSCRVF